MTPDGMVRTIAGKRYDTDKAEVVASDAYWDGHNFERHGHNTYLYKTAKGAFFTVHLTQWQGELNPLEPVTREQAMELWDSLPEHEMEWEEAFGVAAVEA